MLPEGASGASSSEGRPEISNIHQQNPPLPALPLNPHAPAPAIGDLDLDLKLGQPGVEYWSHKKIFWMALEELLASEEDLQLPLPPLPTALDNIRERIWLENQNLPAKVQRPLAGAEQLLQLKGKIVETAG